MTSPTQRSLKKLRGEGWAATVVEHYSTFTHRRHDLFGIGDILAVRGPDTLLVQTTSGSNVSARVRKIEASEALGALREAGWMLHVHGWRKHKRPVKRKYWRCRVVDVS